VARLSRLVENVLDLSRLEAGAAAPHLALWEPAELIAQAAAEVSAPGRLRLAAPDDLPAVRVDAVQMQRVLANLLENALKFSGDPVDVRARLDGGRILVDVLDRGPGIDESPSSQRGLGLGLAIAHGFAEANGATLALSLREGGGTRARLIFAAVPLPLGVAS
jgi:two-component system sensor histidine kinase KdpD